MRGFSYKPYAELKNAEYKGISLEKDQETGNYTDTPNKFAFDPNKYNIGISTPSPNMINEGLKKTLDGENINSENKGDSASLGSKAMGASGEILQTGFQTFANFKNVSQSSEERTAQIMQGAAAGGQIGFALGGPIGGIAGAAVVGGINALDAASDKRKNIETADIEAKQEFEKKKNERLKRFNAGNSLLGFNQTKVV